MISDKYEFSDIDSIFSIKSLFFSTLLSIIVHIIYILYAIANHGGFLSVFGFWIFFLTDIILLSLIFNVFYSALVLKRLKWYDPLLWMFLIIFLMSSLILPSYFIDREYILNFISFGSYVFANKSENYILLILSEAQFVFILFVICVLITNRKIYKIVNRIEYLKRDNVLAVLISMILGIAGVYGFIKVWSTGSFVDSLLLNMGSAQFAALQVGNGRYFILQNMGTTVISLGLCGFLGLLGQRGKNVNAFLSLICIAAILLSIIPDLVFGSRISVVISVVVALIQLRFAGFKVDKKALLFSLMLVVLVVGFITILRGNTAVSRNGLKSVVDIRYAAQDYLDLKGNIVGPMVDLDRVGAIALVIEFTNTNKEYLYGESMLAGPGNIFMGIISKIGGQDWAQNVAFRQANVVLSLWRFGRSDLGWAVPPSFPGEFYMQFGFISLIVFSYVFGLLFARLRKIIMKANSIFARWFNILIAMILVKFMIAETSSVFSFFVFVFLPILVVYELLSLSVGKKKDGFLFLSSRL